MNKKEFSQLLARFPVFLDGATGSNLLKKGMPRNTCAEAWILDSGREILKDLQREYASAGSRIVYAPTFSANRLSLERHGLADRVRGFNLELTALSREAVGPDVFVAGDMTTTGQLLEPLGELEEEELLDVYREQAQALYDAGADLFIAETLLSVREAEIAFAAVREVCELPFMATLTVDENGHALFGGTAEELAVRMQALGADAAGVNCSCGPEQMREVIRKMASAADIPLIAKPNAGLPKNDAQGNVYYDMEPSVFASEMKTLASLGASILGGCCGTTPAYIAAMREEFK